MTKAIKWGILAPGNIAHRFAKGLSVIPDAELIAVGSGSKERADAFADEFDVPRRYGSYEDLVSDPDVDAIYVATLNTFHKECSILCLRAGKAVLCEKPFAINAEEAKEMIACAKECRQFLMEAMWTRFLPVMVKVRELLADGAIGEPRMLTADFGIRKEVDPESRIFNPKLGGGGLLDVGIYTIAMAFMVFGGAPPKLPAWPISMNPMWMNRWRCCWATTRDRWPFSPAQPEPKPRMKRASWERTAPYSSPISGTLLWRRFTQPGKSQSRSKCPSKAVDLSSKLWRSCAALGKASWKAMCCRYRSHSP